MGDIDQYASLLLEEAKRFLEKSRESQDRPAQEAYLHACILLAFCSLEAHINAIALELGARDEISIHEKALLLEKEVRLECGEFVLSGLKMTRIEDRIALLHRKFTGQPFDKQVPWWGPLSSAMNIRNKLSHPKGAEKITDKNASDALSGIISAINSLYVAIYRKNLPSLNRGLQSRLEF